MHLRHSLRKIELALQDSGVFEVCLLVSCHSFPQTNCNSRNAAESRFYRYDAMLLASEGTNYLTRLIAAIPEAICLANFSIWLPQVRFASMSTPKDFDVDTWFMGVPLMLRTGQALGAFSFCIEQISINSVIYKVWVCLRSAICWYLASLHSNRTEWYSHLYQRR